MRLSQFRLGTVQILFDFLNRFKQGIARGREFFRECACLIMEHAVIGKSAPAAFDPQAHTAFVASVVCDLKQTDLRGCAHMRRTAGAQINAVDSDKAYTCIQINFAAVMQRCQLIR